MRLSSVLLSEQMIRTGERGISLSSPTAEMRNAVYKYASRDYGGKGG